MRAELARGNEAIVRDLLDVMAENAAHLAEKVRDPDLSFKERADAQYKLSLSEGIAVDKSLLLRGDPTSIVEHKTLDEDIKALKRMGIDVDVVDTEAVELGPEEAEADTPLARIATPCRSGAAGAGIRGRGRGSIGARSQRARHQRACAG